MDKVVTDGGKAMLKINTDDAVKLALLAEKEGSMNEGQTQNLKP